MIPLHRDALPRASHQVPVTMLIKLLRRLARGDLAAGAGERSAKSSATASCPPFIRSAPCSRAPVLRGLEAGDGEDRVGRPLHQLAGKALEFLVRAGAEVDNEAAASTNPCWAATLRPVTSANGGRGKGPVAAAVAQQHA